MRFTVDQKFIVRFIDSYIPDVTLSRDGHVERSGIWEKTLEWSPHHVL